MDINDLVKDYPCLEPVRERVGSRAFYPPQEDAFRTGFLSGKNLLLSSPTSSGKTLVAQLGMLVNKSRAGKSVYLVPLRSLAQEKFNDFTEFFNGLLKVGISIGDLTVSDERLGRCDVIVCSYEKFDSLLRHRVSWIRDVTLAVFDEVHLIDDKGRGPLIEVLLTRLKRMRVNIIGLSATVGNPEALGDWLDALTVKSFYRPVKLLEGALKEGVVKFKNDSRLYNAETINELCAQALSKGKQSLVFVNNRRSAEATAEKLGAELKSRISSNDLKALSELSVKVLNALGSPTVQCKRLSDCVRNGVAFNHAGLVNSQKNLIESAFRQGLIKVISCTTVLAYGVSLPAYLVVLRDLKRYTDAGMDYIPVSEYLQIAGRAGRSGYDVEGESVLLTSGDSEYEHAWSNYLCAKPTELVSKLGVESALMFHSLALVCDGSCSSIDDLAGFFKESFFGHEYGSEDFLRERIINAVNDLIDYGLINEVGGSLKSDRKLDVNFLSASELINDVKSSPKLVPSRLGARVNELYINPFSARIICQGLAGLKVNALSFLHLSCMCSEVKCLNLNRKDYAGLLESIALSKDNLMLDSPGPFDYEYEGFVRALKTGLMIEEWISESSEDKLMESYGVPPGELHSILSNLEWVLYSIGEIANVQGIAGVREYVNGLITRVKYGVKSELLELVSLEGIGRVRARKLYVNGFKSVSELRAAGVEKLNRVLGPKVAYKVLNAIKQ